MNNLKKLRLRRGALQKDVAEAVGVDRTTYGKYESGAIEPSFVVLLALAEYFGVSIDCILGREEVPDTPAPRGGFQENLALIRRERGLSQEQLADAAGVSRSAIGMWESGHSQPDGLTLVRLASALGVSADELLGKPAEEKDGEEGSGGGTSFSAKLRELRRRAGMTQGALADKIGVERSSVGKYETGTVPSFEVLQNISGVFGVSIDLLTGDEPLPPERSKHNRVAALRRERRMLQKDVAAQLGVTPNTLSNWENGKYEPDLASLAKLSEIFGVSVDYIIGNSDNPASLPLRSAPKDASFPGAIPVPKTAYLPIYGTVSAGLGMHAEQELLGYEPSEEAFADGKHFFLRVKGDSMEPTIRDGDLVLVERDAEIENDNIIAVIVDGDEGVLKRVRCGLRRVELISDNPAYPSRVFAGAEVDSIHVVGRAIELRKRL